DAGLPHPAEIELEPEQVGRQPAQQIEERRAARDRHRLRPVIVETKADAPIARSPRGVGEPLDHLIRALECLGIDPADGGAVDSENAELLGNVTHVALDRLHANVTTRRDEIRRVEPRPHLLRRVAVQLEELDTVEALLTHGTQHTFEIAVAGLTDRPELKPNAWHATKSKSQGRGLRALPTIWFQRSPQAATRCEWLEAR